MPQCTAPRKYNRAARSPLESARRVTFGRLAWDAAPVSAAPSPNPRSIVAPVAAGVAAVLALIAAVGSLAPIEFPAWPAVSLGLVAVFLSTRPGPALGRAVSAFLGVIAIIVGIAQIAAMYGAAAVLQN